ncbi:unnamed protein product [Allacma fusca]|uniref:Uncharacterized protein n=1 Tax=Allacma fusca TaxID=39272 RepID=A0A8J2JSE7_9HEXA|nr:unnamed protein product [Allacma fusca]
MHTLPVWVSSGAPKSQRILLPRQYAKLLFQGKLLRSKESGQIVLEEGTLVTGAEDMSKCPPEGKVFKGKGTVPCGGVPGKFNNEDEQLRVSRYHILQMCEGGTEE